MTNPKLQINNTINIACYVYYITAKLHICLLGHTLSCVNTTLSVLSMLLVATDLVAL